MTTVYITRYALTQGILSVNARMSNDGDMAVYRTKDSSFDQYAHGCGKDWHYDPESAKQRAEAMRLAKIKSYNKNIAKLEKMTFDTIIDVNA